MRPVTLILLVLLALTGVLGWLLFASDGESTDEGSTAAIAPGDPQSERDSDDEPEPTLEPSTSSRRDVESARASNDSPREVQAARVLNLKGLVIDGRGKPVAGVRVSVGRHVGSPGIALDAEDYPPDALAALRSATTNDNGVFELRVKGDTHSWSIAARKQGFAAMDRHGTKLPTSGSHRLADLVLDRGIEILGHVVNSDGNGVPEAELLTARDRGSASRDGSRYAPGTLLTRSDMRGAFRIDSLPAGEVRLFVRGAGHPEMIWIGPVASPGERLVGIQIELSDAASLAGQVVQYTGEPMEGMNVVVLENRNHDAKRLASAVTDSDGNFEITGLALQTHYFLRAHHADQKRQGASTHWLTDSIVVPADSRSAKLILVPPFAVVFRPIDADSRATMRVRSILAQVEIGRRSITNYDAVLQPEVDWMTLPDGSVRIPRFPWSSEGCRGTLVVEVEGRSSVQTQAFRPQRGSQLDLGELVFSGNAELAVVVSDAKTGAPIRGARVHLEPHVDPSSGAEVSFFQKPWGMSPAGSRNKLTDRDGTVSIEGERNARYNLWADHPDYARSTPLLVTPGSGSADAPHQIALSTGGSVTVFVRDSEGHSISNLVLRRVVFDDDGGLSGFQTSEQTTDDQGRARFGGLQAGDHGFGLEVDSEFVRRGLFRLNPSLENDGLIHVQVSEGSDNEIYFVTPSRIDLTGRVTEALIPLPGAIVRLYGDRDEAYDAEEGFSAPSQISSTTDGRGEYRFEGLVAGSYAVTVEHPSHAMRQHWVINLAQDNARCDLDLEMLIVEGQLTAPDGSPVSGARVRVERVREDADELPDWLVADLAEASRDGAAITQSVVSAADGSYSIRGLDASGPLILVAEGDWLITARSAMFGFEEGTNRTRVDLVLSGAGGARAVLDSISRDFSGYQLAAYPVDIRGPRHTSRPANDEGIVALRGLKPGRYRFELISFLRTASLPSPIVAEIEAGRELELLFIVE